MKTKYNMTLKQPYFDLIKAGKKTIELRLYDEKRRQIKVGDEITFQNGDNFHTVIVEGLLICDDFEKLFKFIDVKQTGLNTVNNAIEVMEKFYPKDLQRKKGVIGIIIKNKKDA